MKKIAIVLAGGSGKRMHSAVPKQYLMLKERPVLYYSLAAFDKSEVDEIILVTGESDLLMCQKDIVERYHISKVSHIVAGGKERYDSVISGLRAIEEQDGLVLIHDGARPCLTQEIIQRCISDAMECKASVAAMPVKDTIKIADDKGYAKETPDRSTLWQIQTPQTFNLELIRKAYALMEHDLHRGNITDDAMVVEKYLDYPVKLTAGGYNNIKITTPEDLKLAEVLLPIYN